MSTKSNFKHNASQKQPPLQPALKPTSPYLLLPFIFAIAVIPLIIRYASVENHLSDQSWHGSSTTTTDLFLYYKSLTFIIISAIMLLILISYRIYSKKRFLKDKALIPIYVYMVCIVLSAVYSEYSYFTVHGIENHFESVFVLLGYCLFVLYAAYFVDSEKNLKWVLNGWLIGTLALTIIGVFQAFKQDIFKTEFIKKIILPESMWDVALQLKFTLGKVYITLYNPNYIGYFIAITIPVFLVLALFTKKIWLRTIYGLTVTGLLICLFGSEAKNGIIALAASLAVLIVAFRKKILRYWRFIVGFLCVIILSFVGINALKGNYLVNSIKTALTTTNSTTGYKLDDIETQKDCVAIKYDGQLCFIQMDIISEGKSASFTFVDSTGASIPYKVDSASQKLTLDDERFPFTIQLVKAGDVPCCQITIEDQAWIFTNQLGTEGYFYLNAIGRWATIQPAKTAVFTDMPSLASNRGYIWARAIPLLKDYPLIGSGPDTFVFTFPQNDYVEAIQIGFKGMIISKPHNLYLQMGVQTGVVSLIAFIAFYLIYLIHTIKLYWIHSLDTFLSQIGVAICAGTFGYMVSGLANDSTITYAFVFWGMMGVGIAVNHLAAEEQKNKKTQ